MRVQSAIALFTVTLMSCGSAYAKHPKPLEPSEFENAEIRVEQNATDGDTEVVIFAKGGDDGFKHFRVGGPTGAPWSRPSASIARCAVKENCCLNRRNRRARRFSPPIPKAVTGSTE